MKDFIFDPETAHRNLIERMQDRLEYSLKDPTNPFVLMLESISESNTSVLNSTLRLFDKNSPIRANNIEELMKHTTDMSGFFATPSNSTVTLYLNTVDLMSHGIVSSLDVGSKSIQISRGTTILVDNIELSTRNSIKVHYDGTNSIVEQINDSESRIGSILSYIIDSPTGKWIKFDIPVVQFSYIVKDYDVIGTFRKKISYTDDIWYMEAEGTFTSGVRNIPLTTTDYDKSTTTLKYTLKESLELGKYVEFDLPNVYKFYETLESVRITVFTTKGKIEKDLADLTSYAFEIVKVPTDLEFDVVAVRATSDYLIYGGENPKTFEDMKEMIVSNVTGPIKAPVTFAQLKEIAKRAGYVISLYKDMVTNRLFTITALTSKFKDDYVLPTIMLNNTEIVDDVNFKVKREYDSIIIEAGAIFENKNGIVAPVKDQQLIDTYLQIGGYGQQELLNHIDNIFFTPYTNVVYSDYTTRTFELNKPIIDNINIVSRNQLAHTVNVSEFDISIDNSTYSIKIKIAGLDTLELTLYNIKAQLKIPTIGNGMVHFNNIEPAKTK